MIAFAPACLMTVLLAAGPLADEWHQEFSSEEAMAEHVLALWHFHSGAELEDSSGRGHTLTLHGAQTTADGKFGGGLQSFPGWPIKDERHAAVAQAHPDLSPIGSFTIDLWLKPSADLPDGGNCYILCKKYVSHNDYQLLLTSTEGQKRRLELLLGFGGDSESFYSDAVDWPADVWQHVAVTYDGEGTAQFYRNGEWLGGRTVAGRRSIAPGPLPLSIGDRTGSSYAGFAGVLDQVRISRGVREFGRVRLELELERRVFQRMEPHGDVKAGPTAIVRVTSLHPEPLAHVTLEASLSGGTGSGLTGREVLRVMLRDLEPGETRETEARIDTTLRPDEYVLRVRAEVAAEDAAGPQSEAAAPYRIAQTHPLRIVGRPIADRMPVVMWGVAGVSEVAKELPRLRRIGFTHCLGMIVDEHQIWQTKAPQTELRPDQQRQVAAAMDAALAGDLRVLIPLSPGHTLGTMTGEFARTGRDGKPLAVSGVNGLYPAVQEFCENVGFSVGTLYGKYPAFDGALIHSEVRDSGAALSFSDVDLAAYRQATGLEIPAEATAKWGVQGRSLAEFPSDGVIADDHRLYRYLQWFWREGDAWPLLNSMTARGLRRGAPERADLWTFHDPAVRAASAYGSGGEVDVLSQWTYSYPEPLRLGLPTDELFAMARGAERPQSVMKMTQLIWYRSQTAPMAKADAAPVSNPFDDHDPDAAYITIAPMHLREALWTKISRPVQGIMYHGWQSLVPVDYPSAYVLTHAETQHELQRLVHDVIEPLGPMLRRAPSARNDVAFYESFAAQMFAGRGAYGWSHTWTGDCYQVLQRAGLQADVLYDETIARFGLDGYRVLVIPDGDVLTKTVVEHLLAFQRRGGIIVADDRLASAVTPDIRLTPVARTNKADADKAALLERAESLRRQLEGKYAWPAESSNLDVVPYRREFAASAERNDKAAERGAASRGATSRASGKGSTYLFLVNDNREFGTYVGQHGLVQENGRESETTVTLRRQPQGSVVYDLLAHRRVAGVRKTAAEGGLAALTWPVTLGPCDGRVFLSVPRRVASIRIATPDAVSLGQRATCVIEVHDDRDAAVPAVLPLRVELRDPDGRPAEFSGYHAAVKGRLQLDFDIAGNDRPGSWYLHVDELASGLSAGRELIVHDDSP